MLVIAWRFSPAPGRETEFRQAYGPDGAWARLFARAPGFLGTELLRERGSEDRWLTLDRWRTALDHEAFASRFGAEYAELDARCEALTAREERIGEFEGEGQPVQAAS